MIYHLRYNFNVQNFDILQFQTIHLIKTLGIEKETTRETTYTNVGNCAHAACERY